MLLVIDIGNTNIVLGVYRDKELIGHWRISTDQAKTSDEYGLLFHQLIHVSDIQPSEIKGAIISCVVPPLLNTIEVMCKEYFSVKPLVVGPGIKTGMPVLYDNPREVGADRIVNAVAAYEKFKTSVIVVDFGTATTFDCVSKKGEYLGGVIAPGLMISTEALVRAASKLPRVELTRPDKVIGKNTIHSIQSGIIFGYAGLIDRLVTRIKEEMKDNPRVVATGGLASLVVPESETIKEIDQFLTLEGLRIIFLRNR